MAPPQTPDLAQCKFSIYRLLKDHIYVCYQLIYPTSETGLMSKLQIKVWDELIYRLNVCNVTNIAHIENC